jgi:hypothetical protein
MCECGLSEISVMRSLVFKAIFGNDGLDEFLSATDSNFYENQRPYRAWRAMTDQECPHAALHVLFCFGQAMQDESYGSVWRQGGESFSRQLTQ